MIYLISLKNELSGSCVSIKSLSALLTKNSFKNEIISSKGQFLKKSEQKLINTSFGFFTILNNIKTLRHHSYEKDGLIIFNTILQLPYYLFIKHKNKILYIHEQDLNPRILYKLINYIINKFNIRVAVVNPQMLQLYRNSILLPNVLEKVQTNYLIKNKKKQVLMISNCNLNKGINDFVELARIYSNYNFILLTNKSLAKQSCLDIVLKNKNLINFRVEFDQSKKKELLKESLCLLSLSYYNETFGLVLYEALSEGTLPLSVENDGSLYCLNKEKLLIHSRNTINKEFDRIINDIVDNYDKLFDKMKHYINEEFSEDNILKIINKIYKGIK